jgi:uncharacterized membrane protein YbhN (UPF0104 family)
MKIRRALVGLALVSGLYLAALFWADSKNNVFAELPKLLAVLPLLMAISLSSYVVRYLRWYWLLHRAGHTLPVIAGFAVYLSGLAFTATPGKVGELVRIRYLEPHGVPPWRALAAFVYERAFDLLAVLLLATLVIVRKDVYVYVVGFVVLFIGVLVMVAMNPGWLTAIAAFANRHAFTRIARAVVVLRDGLAGCRVWATPLDALVAIGFGLTAWGLTAYSFVVLLRHLDIGLPFLLALAIYPLATLAGAASMMPGGVGSTEVTIVALLAVQGVGLGIATLAAVGIRLGSIWFSVAIGFLVLALLELRRPS